MRAIVITTPGGPEVLEVRDVPAPVPGPGDVLVRIAATAVNRADLLQRMGRYPPPPGWPEDIPGLEYAGTVEATGDDVAGRAPGDRVMGLAGGGTYAELVRVPAIETIAVPSSLGLHEAAAIPEAFITAWDAMIVQAGLAKDDVVLVHGAASGVGTAALQIARAVGARTIGTSRSAWKLDRLAQYGLDIAVDTTKQQFADAVRDATGGKGADVIIDLVGGDYLAGNIEVLAMHGRLIIVGVVAGATSLLDMRGLMRRRGTIRGTVMRSRPPAEKATTASAFAAFAGPLLENGTLRPVIDETMPLSRAADAHRRVAANETLGKIVLTNERTKG
jgi:putative PIG3 family NAD(P)H quinone oxidoreductase